MIICENSVIFKQLSFFQQNHHLCSCSAVFDQMQALELMYNISKSPWLQTHIILCTLIPLYEHY